jgi:hypothetical protein
MNYKNSLTGEIISFACYQKLPGKSQQQQYIQVVDNPTHIVHEYYGSIMLCILPNPTDYTMIGSLNDSSGGICDGF